MLGSYTAVVRGCQNRFGSHLGVGEFTTHFRTYFSGDWDVHRGVRDLPLKEKALLALLFVGSSDLTISLFLGPPHSTYEGPGTTHFLSSTLARSV